MSAKSPPRSTSSSPVMIACSICGVLVANDELHQQQTGALHAGGAG